MRLFRAMRPHIDLLRAPIRGAFMMEIERMRWRGIPIECPPIAWQSGARP